MFAIISLITFKPLALTNFKAIKNTSTKNQNKKDQPLVKH